ncbi:flagellar type III secretion system pore protein FliP [Thiomicrorhabdus sp. 6S2-11]|jgi:flagellar biosynthetic protein FliP|uniref:Flagellar biosynthetic protein FliP n=1 Tax=Thiomicrorhabdus marina TaxID=2818442 RepID=A0ABS3Q942_9GAMM|nr:flagellar type III secretion system pore protein FliP [Thiomicrorhabdus marina]MBO1928330.1 flagellar type III secretion system pore protein FliP [Thiomicrorhabdus marina]
MRAALNVLALLVPFVLLVLPSLSYAEPGIPMFTVETDAAGNQDYTLTMQILLLMTGLTLLPAALIATTSFLRIIIVLALLRQALGTMQTPSNQVLIGLALFLTMFIMAPVFEKIYDTAVSPYMEEQINFQQALEVGAKPMHQFMLQQTREDDLGMFAEMADVTLTDPQNVPFKVLIPAYMTSELKTAFQIGFMLFIPFLIIDLVVSSLLMSMGMMMLSPMIISLPFKLMLFVLIDGWSLVVGTLANSFVVPGGI